jgi:hypothetical protein
MARSGQVSYRVVAVEARVVAVDLVVAVVDRAVVAVPPVGPSVNWPSPVVPMSPVALTV